MRVIILFLGLIAAAGAVLSIDKMLRDRSAEENASVAPAVILPPSSTSQVSGVKQSVANAVVARVGKNVAALTGAGNPDDKAGPGNTTSNPAFDIARVEPSGDTVIAGRAAPGATVELLRNGKVHDRVVADAYGQFAMVPPRLPAGDSELTLRTQQRGATPATSSQTVVVSVQPNLKDQPVVALMEPDKASVVLSKPEAHDTSAGSVVVEAVEAAPGGGKLYITGHSAPGALVRLYLNDSYQSTATADNDGRVAFATSSDNAAQGDYRVRLDEVDRASGAIKSRAEVPFAAPKSAASAVESLQAPSQRVMVSRGDSLWRISRTAYGDGTRYTVIYDANHNQIRNPDRIYPGQVFIIPGRGH